MFEHLDEDGTPCTQHAPDTRALLALAIIGSRVASFNHDLASKLQGVMMALDEIAEHAEHDPGSALQRAVAEATSSLQEAAALLAANRMLTRTTVKVKTTLRDVITTACERVGVTVRGRLPDDQFEAAVPLLVQAFGLVLDALAGTGAARSVEVTTSGDAIVFASGAAPTPALHDAIALAGFVLASVGGELRCGVQKLIVRLPRVAPP